MDFTREDRTDLSVKRWPRDQVEKDASIRLVARPVRGTMVRLLLAARLVPGSY